MNSKELEKPLRGNKKPDKDGAVVALSLVAFTLYGFCMGLLVA